MTVVAELDLHRPFPDPGKLLTIEVLEYTTLSTFPSASKAANDELQEALDELFVLHLHSDPISPSSWRVVGWNPAERKVVVKIIFW